MFEVQKQNRRVEYSQRKSAIFDEVSRLIEAAKAVVLAILTLA